MFNPKVSIVIPVYNWANYLTEAIDSALNQTYNNIEILVINDWSDDNWATEKIALSYWDKIRYFSKNNWWVASALNFWIENTIWKYISWLSHDDLYYPNKIEEQIIFLNKQKNEDFIITSNFEIVDSNLNKLGVVYCNYSGDELLYKLSLHSFLNGCTFLIKKDILNDVWPFNTALQTTQDYEMRFKMLKKYKFINLDKVLIRSRIHPQQDTNKKIDIVFKERKALDKFILNMFKVSEIKQSANINISNFLFSLYFKSQLMKNRYLTYIIKKINKTFIYMKFSHFWRKYILRNINDISKSTYTHQ